MVLSHSGVQLERFFSSVLYSRRHDSATLAAFQADSPLSRQSSQNIAVLSPVPGEIAHTLSGI